MASVRLLPTLAVLVFSVGSVVRAQLPVSVTSDGMALAQNNPAIDQARLLRDAVPPSAQGVNAYGTALPSGEATVSDDDSMGAQQILKTQEPVRPWTLTANASVVYTDNAALTRNHTRDDVFAAVDASLSWSGRVARELDANFGLHAAFFRYNEISALDFEDLGFGAGVVWSPASLHGANVIARYDFTELLSTDADQILMDHSLTLGVQKTFVFGRAHNLTIGALGIVGWSDPDDAQRSQLAAFLAYHLQVARHLQADFLVRPAAHFYTEAGRTDFNLILSGNVRYRFNEWAGLNGFLGYAFDRSERARFDYNAFTTGAGVALEFRF
jgi:hypothetical protein